MSLSIRFIIYTQRLTTHIVFLADKFLCQSGAWKSSALGLGINQMWRSVSRSAGSTYTNDSGQPIVTAPRAAVGGAGSYCIISVYVNGLLVYYGNSGGGSYSQSLQPHVIVPPGSTYRATTSQCGITAWHELSSS